MCSASNNSDLRFSEWKYLDAHLIWIYEGAPQTDGKTLFQNDYMTAWCILSGAVRVVIGGCKKTVVAGDWVLLPTGQSERYFSAETRLLSLHFEARWITGQSLFELDQPIVFSHAQSKSWGVPTRAMLQRVRKRFPTAYNKLPEAQTDYHTYAAMQGNFQDWLARVWQALVEHPVGIYLPRHSDARALDMKRWLNARSLQQPFRLQEMADRFALSPAQVNRVFCAVFDVTPKRYFEKRRLNAAEAALKSSSHPMKEISYNLGFRHQAEFTAWFKKHSRMSPSAYRQRV